MTAARTGAIVTVGTELVRGLSVDTNSAEIASRLTRAGVDVRELVSVGDDEEAAARILERLVAACDVVVVTGGLGPTHDDITRQAAARALGRRIVRDPAVEATLAGAAARHTDPRAAEQAYNQADVLEGARILPAMTGTAPGQVLETDRGQLVLLPGPPREMRPLLDELVREWDQASAPPAVLRCHGLPESDLQMAAQDVLDGREDIELTVLAKPGDVQVVLFDAGAGDRGLAEAAESIAERIGDACYSTDGSTLAEVVVDAARRAGLRLATAESCTGGLLGGALTSVAGASDVYEGGLVTYSDRAKSSLAGVDAALIERHGAVSEEVAAALAVGARRALGVDVAVSVTGIAGPSGGSADKPVGTVWFGLAGPGAEDVSCAHRLFPGDRETVRARSVLTALDLVRRALKSR